MFVATTAITTNQVFYALALKYTSVGHSSLIMAATPLVVLLMGPKVVGMLVAFGGVAWLQVSHSHRGAGSFAMMLSMGIAGIASDHVSPRMIGLWSGVLSSSTAIFWAWGNLAGRLPEPAVEGVEPEEVEVHSETLRYKTRPYYLTFQGCYSRQRT